LPAARDAKRDSVKLMAGGQDLLGELKEHLIEPASVVNLKHIAGLDALELKDGELNLGALVTIAALADHAVVREKFNVLHEAADSVGSVQIRNVGTVGGNLCQRPRCMYYRHEQAVCIKKGGSECFSYAGVNKYNAILGGGPSYIVHPSDLAPALVALGAEVAIKSKRGERVMPLEQFFTLPSEGSVLRENVLQPDEILTRVRVPAAQGAGWRSTYIKFKERGSYDFALVSVALAARVEGGVIKDARLVLGGVAPIPWRCTKAEKALVGRKIDDETCTAAGKLALEGAQPLTYNAYKVPLAQGLITKALRSMA
jgi:xanthine dehydrogenase YagS FAD-binding subunit